MKLDDNLTSRCSASVGVEEATKAGSADDFSGRDGVLRRRRFVPGGWEIVASGMRAFSVVPRFEFAVDVAFGNDHESIQGFRLQSLDHPFDVWSQVR